jgi:hypothetical protein
MVACLDYLGSGTVTPGGHYRVGLKTGKTTVITGGAAMLCWRWTDSSHLFVPLRIDVTAEIDTAFGTAQINDLALFVNRAWSTSPSAATAVTFSTGEQKMRDMGGGMSDLATFAPVVQIAATGAVTTGTRVQDTYPVGYGVFTVGNSAGNTGSLTLYNVAYGLNHPLALTANEGLEITIPTTQGASGKVVYYVNMKFVVTPVVS